MEREWNSEELLGPRCSGTLGIGEGVSFGELGGMEVGVDQGELPQNRAMFSSSNSMLLRMRLEKEKSGATQMKPPSHGIFL